MASTLTATIAERARSKHSTRGIQYISADLLGIAPFNRSGLGVSGYHVHEVCQSIRSDGLSRRRYNACVVVKVPEEKLQEFHDFNKALLESDDLLPPYSASMRYACLTKNHFVSAVKLFKCASVALHGTKELIKPNPQDTQLSEHLSEGVACEVFSPDLWLHDVEGMMSIIGEDNFDAATNMAASEMEVLQTMRRMLDDLKKKASGPDGGSAASGLSDGDRFRSVLASAIQIFGTQTFSEADLLHLYNYALRVPTSLVENLAQIHFAIIPAALLRVRPIDFGQLAAVDASHPYVKVVIIVSQYLAMIAGGAGRLCRQPGGGAVYCSQVPKKALDALKDKPEGKIAVEAFVKQLLKGYKVCIETAIPKQLLFTRAKLFHRCGKLVLSWPSSDFASRQELARIEEKYAKELVECRAIGERPGLFHKFPETVKSVSDEKALTKLAKTKDAGEGPVILGEIDEAASDAAASNAAASGPVPGAASSPAPVLAHKVCTEGMTRFPSFQWEQFTKELWKKVAVQGLLQAHLRHQSSTADVEAVSGKWVG